ncbi:hypothetical protein EKPJFOCH_2029 [Methylobacterium thuringiense]|uniref:Uncharacterized protein n=1 Tax=Methylobacterium thuringiense TaxID=1003091 RepID=A0ABQ4TN58_9HYPH|nr:hypothetical protein EKPJFOCH_2029 [Methylobacterium thuringiense]
MDTVSGQSDRPNLVFASTEAIQGHTRNVGALALDCFAFGSQ